LGYRFTFPGLPVGYWSGEYDLYPKFYNDCMKFWHTGEGCWSKKKPIDEEEAMPQFQVVKKNRRKNRKPRKTKVEWKATGITRHPNKALVQPCKENVKEASPGVSSKPKCRPF